MLRLCLWLAIRTGDQREIGLYPLKTKIIVVTDRQISQLFLQSIEMVDCDKCNVTFIVGTIIGIIFNVHSFTIYHFNSNYEKKIEKFIA